MDSVDVGSLLGLDGRVALVTGASSGIGARAARVLDSLGATVVLSARREELLKQVASGLCSSQVIACDVAEAGASAALVEEVVNRLGRIDVVVAAAGISNTAPAIKESVADFARLVGIDLVAVYELARAAVLAMRSARNGGAMVLVASSAAMRVTPIGPAAAYSAAKTGLVGLTRELAVQWARYGVRVNALCPGLYPSEITAPLFADETLRRVYEERIPLGRLADGHELDGAIAFLASPASSYVTGQALVVDGGGCL